MAEYDDILYYVPKDKLRPVLYAALKSSADAVEEIRLRSERPLSLFGGGRIMFVSAAGEADVPKENAYTVSRGEITGLFKALCENSLYAYADEIRQGFVTIHGGHRVGFVGRAVVSDGMNGKIENFRFISSLNIRIAREIQGCADGIIGGAVVGGRVRSTLVISPPGVGKTTILRDMARQLSDMGFKVGIADDRSEIAAMFRGVPTCDVGANTDVIENAPKGEGISILLRTMSPQVIVTDELVTEREVAAVCRAKGGGVAVIASVHASGFEDVERKPTLRPLFRNRVFESMVYLRLKNAAEHRIEAEVRRI